MFIKPSLSSLPSLLRLSRSLNHVAIVQNHVHHVFQKEKGFNIFLLTFEKSQFLTMYFFWEKVSQQLETTEIEQEEEKPRVSFAKEEAEHESNIVRDETPLPARKEEESLKSVNGFILVFWRFFDPKNNQKWKTCNLSL